MWVILQRCSPTPSPLLNLRMFIFVLSDLLGKMQKMPLPSFLRLPLQISVFKTSWLSVQAACTYSWLLHEVYGDYLLVRQPWKTGWNLANHVYNSYKHGEHAKYPCDCSHRKGYELWLWTVFTCALYTHLWSCWLQLHLLTGSAVCSSLDETKIWGPVSQSLHVQGWIWSRVPRSTTLKGERRELCILPWAVTRFTVLNGLGLRFLV